VAAGAPAWAPKDNRNSRGARRAAIDRVIRNRRGVGKAPPVYNCERIGRITRSMNFSLSGRFSHIS
jgi:hypothetical protein